MSTFGSAYDAKQDEPGLSDQRNRIRNYMYDGQWRTLYEITRALGYPESSVSAQLRHLRKGRFGSYRVEKRRRLEGSRTWEYRVLSPLPSGQLTFL